MADSKYLDYPFLVDQATFDHVIESKVMFIIRGLPGSGKSTVARKICEKYPNSRVCSADNFFYQKNGTYNFNPDYLKDAHQQCHRTAEEACQSGTPTVVIDNTNIRKWEMQFYIDVAARNDYVTVIVYPQTPWRSDPETLAPLNKHGVSQMMLQSKLEMFDEVLPSYWGWFTNYKDSQMLLDLANKYFNLCSADYPDFRTVLQQMFGPNATYSSIYSRDTASMTSLHCTTYFGADSPMDNRSYSSKVSVRQWIGKVSALHVIGLVFTPRTVGARLALDKQQMTVWGKDLERFPVATPPLMRQSGFRSTSDLVSAMNDLSLEHSPLDQIKTNNRFAPISGRGSRAHFTLGWSRDAKPVQTGEDLLDIVACEQESPIRSRSTGVSETETWYYDKGRCVVYFDQPVKVCGLFTGKY